MQIILVFSYLQSKHIHLYNIQHTITLSSAHQPLPPLLMPLHRPLKRPLKQLINILTRGRRSLIILPTPLLRISNRLGRFHLPLLIITLIPQQKHHNILQIQPIILHSGLPSGQVLEGLLIAGIEYHEDYLGVLEEWVTDLLVVGAAADVEEVYRDVFVEQGYFFYPVVHADGCDVLVDEFALAVSLYYA